jgi:SNF2 family DNA or RNA helicase
LPQESSQFLQLKHLLDNHVAGEKAIFTFNSVNTMLLLYYHIRKWYPEDPDCPIRPLIMSGDMPTPRRRLVGDLFKNDHRYNVLIASSQLVWLGHNYQCANNMYFSDAWYMPQRPRQAVFRMMRPGQMRYTRMVSIVPKGTIVEMILLLDDDKMTTEESVVGGTRGRHSNAQSVISQVLSSFLDTYREGALKKRVSLLGF